MKKFRLELDALEIDSFEVTRDADEGRGTVLGQTGDLRCTTDCPTYYITCGEDTYDLTCAGASCDYYHLCQPTFSGC